VSATNPSAGEIRDYILRRLPEARRAKLEELYFRDDSLLDRVEQAEDELVSDYVLGRLSPTDRKTFEESLLETPYYRERIETTTQMRLQIGRHRAFRKSRTVDGRLLTGRAGFVAAISLLLVLFVAALASALRLKSDLERATRALAVPGAPDVALEAVVLPLPGGAADGRVVRSGTGPLVLVVPGSHLPPAGRPFTISLRAEGRTVWGSGSLRHTAGRDGDLAVRLPAGVPPPGRYDVVLASDGETPGPRVLASLDFAKPEG